MTSTLPHPENEHQGSINDVLSCIVGNKGVVQIFELMTELSTAFKGTNKKYDQKNPDYKIIDITNCKACKNTFLDAE